MMSGSNSPDLSPLDYQIWGEGQSWSLITVAATKAKTVPEFKNAFQLIWSALLENDNAVKDYHK